MCPVLHIGSLTLYTFGLLLGAAICLGTFTFLHYFERHQIPVNASLITVALVSSGFIGAKLDNAVVVGMYILHGHPFSGSLARILSGGYTYLGSLLAGLIAAAMYVQLNRLPWLRVFDATFCIAPAYALGRVGCFLAGDGDYGVASNLPWAMSFPHGIVPTLVRVHPTMLYTTVYELLVFAVLWRLSSPKHMLMSHPGRLLGLYLILTGCGRFAVEFLSRNRPLAFGCTEAQWVSLIFIVAGSLLLLWLRFAANLRGTTGTADFSSASPAS